MNKAKKQPSKTVSYNPKSFTLESFFGGNASLSEEDVMKIPAVQASLDLITSAVGQLPVRLYQKQKNDSPKTLDDDYRVSLINDNPNETLTGYSLKRKITRDFLLYGTSKSNIEYESETSNKISGIYPLDTEDINIEIYTENGYHKYGIVHLSNSSGNYDFYDDGLLSVIKDGDNGIYGRGIIEENSDLLKLALDQIQYERGLLANNATPMGILTAPGKLKAGMGTELMHNWEKALKGKSGSTVLLEDGFKYSPVSINPNDLELKDSKAMVISEIARMFNIPESMINSNATKYDNTEQNYIIFLQNTLSPILEAFVSALNKTLLTKKEQDRGYFFQFDTSQLLKTTWSEKVAVISQEYNNGLISYQEMREQIGEQNIIDDDFIKMSLGSVLYHYNTGDITIPNMGQQLNSNGQNVTSFNEKDSKVTEENATESNLDQKSNKTNNNDKKSALKGGENDNDS